MFGGLFLLQTNVPVSSRPCSDDAMSEWPIQGTQIARSLSHHIPIFPHLFLDKL